MAHSPRLMSLAQQKPTVGQQIDWSHPLAQGLVLSLPLNDNGASYAYDSVSGLLIPPQNGAVVGLPNAGTAGDLGVSSTVANQGLVSGDLSVSHPQFNLQQGTVIWRGLLYGNTATGDQKASFISVNPYNNAQPYACYYLYANASGVVQIGSNNGSAGFNFTTSGSAALPSGTEIVVAYTFTSGSQIAYVNGVAVVSAAQTGTIYYGAGTQIVIGTDVGNNRSLNGHTRQVAIYNRVFSPADLREFQAEPFSMYKPTGARRYFVGASATIIHATGSAAATGNESATASLTIAATGTAAATGSESATAGLAVGATGTASAAGAETATGTVTIAATGTAAATGTETSTATLTIAATGTASATGTATNPASVSGIVIVTVNTTQVSAVAVATGQPNAVSTNTIAVTAVAIATSQLAAVTVNTSQPASVAVTTI